MSQETDATNKCPFPHDGEAAGNAKRGRSNRDWWPNQLNVHILHGHSVRSDPMGASFDYVAELAKLEVSEWRFYC